MSSIPSLSTETERETPSPDLDSSDLKQAAPQSAAGAPAEAPKSSLYRVVWRWHFYAGLIVAPFLLIAAATGALYVFANELSPILYSDLLIVEPIGERLTVDEQLQRLREQVPDLEELDSASFQNNPTRSSRFVTHALPGGHSNPDQMHRSYFVNPYTGELLGSRIMEQEFFHVVLDLHRNLLAGTTGRVLVELATCWGIVLALTGIYLWWPRGKKKITGVWWPRFQGKPYPILRDLHAVIGFYVAGFAIIILFTGLFVSVVWGTGFTMASMQMEQSLMELFAHAESPPASEAAVPALEPVLATALSHSRPDDHIFVQLAEKPEQAHKVYLMYDTDTNTVRGLDIDQYTGELVSATQTEELEPMVRLLALMVSLHQGKTFGMPTKIIAFVTCLILMGLTITGVWMWWDRRPRGKAGFPARPNRGLVPVWGWALVAITGLILPTVGASILLIVLGDWLLQKVRHRRQPASLTANQEL